MTVRRSPVPDGTIDEKGNIAIDPKGSSPETAERLRHWLAVKYNVPVETVTVEIRHGGGYRWHFPVAIDNLADEHVTEATWRNPLDGSALPRGDA